MASSESVNTNHSSSASNAQILPENPAAKKNGWGRAFCGVDKLTLLFGAALIITGVALFVLNALYTADFYIAAVAATSVGSGIFLLGLLTYCCVDNPCKGNGQNSTDKSKTDTPTKTTDVTQDPSPPLGSETSTRAFFESKGVFGLPKELIEEIDIWRLYRTSEDFEIALDAGFILYGPPGTGKTTIAKYITELLGGEYVEKNCGDLNSQWHGATEQNITSLFTVPEGRFRVAVIDEISGLLPKREGLNWSDRIVEHFLGVVSGAEQKAPNYILIGTTNHLEALDDATLRAGRLGKHFKISNPDETARAQIFQYHLNQLKLDPTQDWSKFSEVLAQKTERYSCAAIKGIVTSAQKKGMLAKRLLIQQDFLEALSKY